MGRTWVKLHCREWLEGTLREDTPEVRGIWTDLLVLAGNGPYNDTGEIKLCNGIGYTDNQICDILAIKPAQWRKAKQRLLETERIKIAPKGAISIISWKKYQSEYARQKPYRVAKAAGSASKPDHPL